MTEIKKNKITGQMRNAAKFAVLWIGINLSDADPDQDPTPCYALLIGA
jgi:hypothetical protein